MLLAHEPTVLVSTALVVAETGWLISRQLGAVAEAGFYRSVVDGELQVRALDREDWVRVSKLTGKYAGNDLGGVDPSLVAVAERLRLNTIATLDHGHLRAVRPKHVEAFRSCRGWCCSSAARATTAWRPGSTSRLCHVCH